MAHRSHHRDLLVLLVLGLLVWWLYEKYGTAASGATVSAYSPGGTLDGSAASAAQAKNDAGTGVTGLGTLSVNGGNIMAPTWGGNLRNYTPEMGATLNGSPSDYAPGDPELYVGGPSYLPSSDAYIHRIQKLMAL